MYALGEVDTMGGRLWLIPAPLAITSVVSSSTLKNEFESLLAERNGITGGKYKSVGQYADTLDPKETGYIARIKAIDERMAQIIQTAPNYQVSSGVTAPAPPPVVDTQPAPTQPIVITWGQSPSTVPVTSPPVTTTTQVETTPGIDNKWLYIGGALLLLMALK